MRLLIRFKFEILVVLVFTIIYLVFRLPNLTYQPIFADEAIYVRWAQVMRAEPTLRFVPLSDGKTPLFMWAMIPLFKVLPDPLFAGRLLSVISGYFTFLGAFLVARFFFNRKTAFWVGFIIVTAPFTVFFDRMALVDSMLAAFSIWALFLALLLVKHPRLDLAMILGYVLGAGILTKTPGFFNILTVPVSILSFNFSKQNRAKRVVKLFLLWVVSIVIAMLIYNILRLGPGFVNLDSRNQDYVFSPSDILNRPLDPFVPHFWDMVDWFPKLIGYPILAAGFLGIFSAFYKKNKYALTIFFWGLLPLIALMALLKTFTARYIFFPIVPFLILGGFGIASVLEYFGRYKKIASVLILVLVISWPAYFNFLLLTDLEKLPLSKNERIGYLEEWTAGYGLKEIAGFLDEKSKSGVVVVGTEGSFGTLPDGLQIYLDKNRDVIVIGGRATISAQLKEAALEHPTYFVTNKSRYPINSDDAKLVKEYPKLVSPGRTQDAILLYEVISEPTTSAKLQKGSSSN